MADDVLRLTVDLVDNASPQLARIRGQMQTLGSSEVANALRTTTERVKDLRERFEPFGEDLKKASEEFIPPFIRGIGGMATGFLALGIAAERGVDKIKGFTEQLTSLNRLQRQTGVEAAQLKSDIETAYRGGIDTREMEESLKRFSAIQADLMRPNSRLRQQILVETKDEFRDRMRFLLDEMAHATGGARLELAKKIAEMQAEAVPGIEGAENRRRMYARLGLPDLGTVHEEFKTVSQEMIRAQEAQIHNAEEFERTSRSIETHWKHIQDAWTSKGLDLILGTLHKIDDLVKTWEEKGFFQVLKDTGVVGPPAAPNAPGARRGIIPRGQGAPVDLGESGAVVGPTAEPRPSGARRGIIPRGQRGTFDIPQHQEGGFIPRDQFAMLHAGEMIQPAEGVKEIKKQTVETEKLTEQMKRLTDLLEQGFGIGGRGGPSGGLGGGAGGGGVSGGLGGLGGRGGRAGGRGGSGTGLGATGPDAPINIPPGTGGTLPFPPAGQNAPGVGPIIQTPWGPMPAGTSPLPGGAGGAKPPMGWPDEGKAAAPGAMMKTPWGAMPGPGGGHRLGGPGDSNFPAGGAVTGGASGLNESEFNKAFKGTALEGKAGAVAAEANKHNIPPNVFAGIIAEETGFGKNTKFNNVAGMMDKNSPNMTAKQRFESIDQGIAAAADLAGRRYNENKRDIAAMGRVWAPPGAANDPNRGNAGWPGAVTKFSQRFAAPAAAGAVPSGEYEGVGGYNFAGSQRARAMGIDIAAGQGMQKFATGIPEGQGPASITANRYAGTDIAGFLGDLHAAGAPLGDFSGVYANRNKRGGGGPSQHAYGNAVDIETGFGSGPDNSRKLWEWAQKNPEKFAEIQAQHSMRNLDTTSGASMHDWGHFEWTPTGRRGTALADNRGISNNRWPSGGVIEGIDDEKVRDEEYERKSQAQIEYDRGKYHSDGAGYGYGGFRPSIGVGPRNAPRDRGEMDRSLSHTVTGTGKISVDVNAPKGTNVKASGGGLFKKTEVKRQTQMDTAAKRAEPATMGADQ